MHHDGDLGRTVSHRPRHREFEDPIKVGILVDLELGPGAGGHVKFWERIARAAVTQTAVDLTVHFSGRRRETVPLACNVRYVIEPPQFSTERLPFLSHVPAHTDLAPWHPRLLRSLQAYDVIHTTDAYFAYARTASRAARRWQIPFVTSVHTNTPDVARLFTALTIERVLGRGLAAGLLVNGLNVPDIVARRMERRLVEHQKNSAFTFVARRDQLAAAASAAGGRAGLLRRGIDHDVFHPAKRDRDWLRAHFGIDPACFVVLFVGQLTPSKNARTLVEALRSQAASSPLKLVCAGQGQEKAAIEAALGPRVLCPGHLEPETLSRLYASSDVFAFPSQIEECANVVLEALASGLPALVSVEGGMDCIVVDGETGYVLPGRAPQAWAAAIDTLRRTPSLRQSMAASARRHAEAHIPSWRQVLDDDLQPRWREAACARRVTEHRMPPRTMPLGRRRVAELSGHTTMR